jgi:hypothetical protein
LTKQFQWWTAWFQFPFPAYVHIIQDLRKRPLSIHAEQAWTKLSENYEARRLGDVGSGTASLTGGGFKREEGPVFPYTESWNSGLWTTPTRGDPSDQGAGSGKASPAVWLGSSFAKGKDSEAASKQQQHSAENIAVQDMGSQDWKKTRYGNVFLRLFGRICLAAWQARETAILEKGQMDNFPIPPIVLDIRNKMGVTGLTPPNTNAAPSQHFDNISNSDSALMGMDMTGTTFDFPTQDFNMPSSAIDNAGFDMGYGGIGFDYPFNFNFNAPFGVGFDGMSPGGNNFGQVPVSTQGQSMGATARAGENEGMEWVVGNFDSIGPRGF